MLALLIGNGQACVQPRFRGDTCIPPTCVVDGQIVDKAVIYITRWRCRTPRDQQGWPNPSLLGTLPPISHTFNINGDLHTSTQHSSLHPISFASVRRRSDEATFAEKDELCRRLLGILRQFAKPADSADPSSVAIKVRCKRWFSDESDLACTRTRACATYRRKGRSSK